MSAEREAHRLFTEALDLPIEARALFLSAIGDPAVRGEVEELLAASEQVDGFLSAPARLSASVSPVSLPEYEDGTLLGDFEIERLLGRGGFGAVYLARQRSLDRRVALKATLDLGAEARTMARIDHEHVVRVYSEERDPRTRLRLICMQYVAGTDLERALAAVARSDDGTRPPDGSRWLELLGRLSPPEVSADAAALKERDRIARMGFFEIVLSLGVALAEALETAHQRGVLHLDVKPSNVLLTPHGKPLLTDFNVAVLGAPGAAEASEVHGGTWRYMAPEHALAVKGEAIRLDARADVFALGRVLAECFEKAGVCPDEATRAVLDRALDEERERRWPSAAAFGRALESRLEGKRVEEALPRPGPLMRWTERSPLLACSLLTLLPQVLGSAFNISYNSIWIVSHLTAGQQGSFRTLVPLYNLVVYPIAAGWFLARLFRWRRLLTDRSARVLASAATLASARRSLLGLPRLLMGLTTLGWLPGMIFFPAALHVTAGGLPGRVWMHFAASFLLSWLIALTYSILYSQLAVVRVFYPWLLGAEPAPESERRAVRRAGSRMRVFLLASALIPLLGAAAVLAVGPEALNAVRYRSFQWLTLGLIGMGMAGLCLASHAAHALADSVVALTGRASPET